MFKRDWGLIARMVFVFVCMGALYALFIGALAMFMDMFVAAIITVGLLSSVQFLWGHKIALKSMGGRTVSEEQYPELHARVQRLAQQAEVPKPSVAVADREMPNAFAAGRSKKTSVVCVTTGLLETLDDDELDGVLAHELAHIKHHDMAVMTIASTLSMLSFYVVRWGWLGDSGDSGNQHVLAAIAVSFVVWVVSFFLVRVLSRYREYAADRGAAQITGNPSALAIALQKISGRFEDVPREDLRETQGVNALLFAEPDVKSRVTRWMSTHPSIEQRVEQLRDMESELHA